MKILNNENEPIDLTQNKIEIVQKQQTEYKIVGTFLRTPGLNLYGYDYLEDKIHLIEVEKNDTVHIKVLEDNSLIAVDMELEKTLTDHTRIYFEALNIKNAKKRVEKFKKNEIEDLSNLRTPGKIDFFNQSM
jgi:hypothetical protein